MSTLTTAPGKVGENYIIAASDVSTFAASFPELAAQALDSINQVGDGSLTVNAEILQDAKNTTYEKIKLAKEETIAALEQENETLQRKIDAAQAAAEAADTLAQ
jgi:hypothetical protein